MSPNSTQLEQDRQRLIELLADRALGELSEGDQRELEGLLRRVPGARRVEAEYDELEARLVLAMHAVDEPMPQSVRKGLIDQGLVELALQGAPAPIPMPGREPTAAPRVAAPRRGGWDSWSGRLGWLVAAAAVALAAMAWWPGGGATPATRTLAQERGDLLREDPGAISVLLDPAEGAPEGLVMEVVWSDAQQRGYLRVRGLAVNDPAREQYQVWITDEARGDDQAVTAGVFDITPEMIDPATRDAIIPLDPSLRIASARSFAVTVERAGGVVAPGMGRVVGRGVVG